MSWIPGKITVKYIIVISYSVILSVNHRYYNWENHYVCNLIKNVVHVTVSRQRACVVLWLCFLCFLVFLFLYHIKARIQVFDRNVFTDDPVTHIFYFLYIHVLTAMITWSSLKAQCLSHIYYFDKKVIYNNTSKTFQIILKKKQISSSYILFSIHIYCNDNVIFTKGIILVTHILFW